MLIKTENKLTTKEKVNVITIKNNLGFEVALTDVGAAIYSIAYPDKKGQVLYVTNCPKDFDEFIYSSSNYGKTVGPVAGRLKDAKAIINNKVYNLEKNEGPNCLHSGNSNYATRRFDYEIKANEKKVEVIFSLKSKDGDCGLPGEVKVKIIYTIYEHKKELNIKFLGKCSEPTLLNLTNHVYLNLNGGLEPIYNQELYLRASKVSKLDQGLIIQEFENVPPYLDFTHSIKIGKNILSPQLLNHATCGIDHVFLLDDINKNIPSAVLYNPENKRKMTLYTNYPAVVIYGYNHPSKTENLSNQINEQNFGITFETVIPTNDCHNITFSKEKPYNYFAKYKFN